MRAGRFSFPFRLFHSLRVPSREANSKEPLRRAGVRTFADRIGVRGNRARDRGRTGRPSWRSRARLRRRLGSRRARSRGFFAHRRIVNSNRDTSSSAAPGHELGGLPRGWRARPPRGCGEQPRPAASSRGAPPPPPGRFDPARRCPLGPARLGTAGAPVNARGPPADGLVSSETVWRVFFFFLFTLVHANRRRRSY